MNTLLLYPKFPDTFWSFHEALWFVGKKAANPPLGLITIASMLPKEWERRLVDLNVQELHDQDIEWADMVFISAMDVHRDSVKELVTRCKSFGKKIIAGGPLFTGEYASFPGIDHFVLNEGELTFPEFLKDLENNSLKPIYTTDQYADITQTPIPQWDLLDFSSYDCMSVQFSRGCPFNCDFCNVTAMLGHKPRIKTTSQLIAELDSLYNSGWRRNVFLVDDNFIGNKRILKEEVLPALIEWRKDKMGNLFVTEASINLADDEELMQLMAKAGFINIFIGIETPNEVSLQECNKGQNKGRDLVESVKVIQRHGMQVMGGFIVGFDNDDETIFQRQIDFIQQSGIVTSMVGILQAPFGTELYKRLKAEGRVLDEMSGDNGDGDTNIVPRMDINRLKAGYREIVGVIYDPKYFYKRVKTFLKEYQPVSTNVTIMWEEIRALLRTIYKLGIFKKERRYYWDLLFWTLFRFPSKLPMAITLTVYGYHFRTVSERVLGKNNSRPTPPPQQYQSGRKLHTIPTASK